MEPLSERLEAELEVRFTYHPPSAEQVPKYNAIRSAAYDFARTLGQLCPESTELTRALDKLDEVVMLANAAIARRS